MVRCAVCDGGKFFEKDGLYYCDTCSTQCPDLHTTLAETDYTERATAPLSAFQISTIYAPSEDSGHEPRKEADGTELFLEKNCLLVQVTNVLRAQVQWLIENAGAKADLEAAVKCIWMSYLEKTLPDVKLFFEGVYHDEIQLALLHNSDWQTLLDCGEHELDAALDFYRRRRRRNSEAFDIPVLTPSDIPHEPKFSLLKPGRKADNPGRITLSRLVAVLAIGLHYCGEGILISDLLRWIRLLMLPCVNPSDIVPAEQMHVYLEIGSKAYGMNVEYCIIEWEMSNLTKFLSIETPLSTEIIPLVERFVQDLNLPLSLIPMIAAVAQSWKCLTSEMRICKRLEDCVNFPQNPEAIAMALIVHVLRALFGFDDRWETILLEAENLSVRVAEPVVFSLASWMNYINLRRVALFKHTALLQSSDGEALMGFMRNQVEWQKTIKKSRLERNPEYENLYLDLGRTLKDSRTIDGPTTPYLPVPTTLRPFRTCGDELKYIYTDLELDFGDHSVDYLFSSSTDWILATEEPLEKLVRSLRNIQSACSHNMRNTFTVHSQVMGNDPRMKPLLKTLSSPLQWLIMVCSEVIEQEPEALLGQIAIMEQRNI